MAQLKSENIIKDKSFDFALKITSLYAKLLDQKEFILSRQLFRCGTSIGANIAESSAAQSINDFIAKLSIASKEARETRYWLELLHKSQFIEGDYSDYLKDIDEIIRIISSIIITTQSNKK